MTKHAKLLWVDLEMTGLEPRDDRIMEVAAIATDWDFKELATFEDVVKIDDATIETRMKGPAAAFWDAHPEARDGLVAQNISGKTGAAIEDALLAFLDENFDDEKVLLAGNSIHQDRRFIRHEWPRLDARLHYRMLDVSAWKVVFEGKFKKKFAKPEEHRALGDIRGSIEELKYYLKKVKA
ncbi:MAG TPA: oligoribonuclease [Candidatus Saccharimonadaceae bacterium]|nr:oligoribonuclease [Candidatus Saccharimonadaceae bacterium]